jgi:signal transduction histidine kinase/ligand-binding sensor domain-containing protein
MFLERSSSRSGVSAHEARRADFASKAKWTVRRPHLLCLFLILITVNLTWAVDPTRHVSQYAHTAWRIQDGVFSESPDVVAQTTDGYLWIGTKSGLVRFDGVRFAPWIPPEGQQLPSNRINSLLGAPDGSLWIGTAVGLSRWHNDHLINYVSEQGVVTSIVQARNGTVWIEFSDPTGRVGPLCQIIGNGMRCHGKDDGIPDGIYTPLAEDSHGNLWLGGSTALVGWRRDSHRVYNPSGLKSNAAGGVAGLAADPDGSLWVGIARPGPGLGLQHLTQGVWKPFRTLELDGSAVAVGTLLLDRENALWVGTNKQGIYRIYGGKVEHFGSPDGLSSDFVFGFFEDREGDLWVSTSKGLDCFRDVRVASFSTREGLSTPEVNSVFAFPDGAIWIGGVQSLDVIHRDRVSSMAEGKGLPGDLVTSIFEDHAGRLWVGIDDTLTIYKEGRFRRINRRNGSPLGMILGITEDVGNNIWVETKGPPMSLIRIQGLEVREEFQAPQMPAARRVAADPEGGIWLGLINGDLARYQHGRIDTFRFQHNPDSRVEQLTVNPDGSVLGATAFGLVGWRGGRQLTLTVRNGLPCDIVYAFISDDKGDLWLSTKCGLVEITNAELQEWWEHPEVVLQPRILDAFDGAQPGRASFGAAARSPDGRLWFANGNLLQMIDPDHLADNPIPPPVHVEGIVADRRNYMPQDGLRLPPLTRDLEVDYTALSFRAPQKVRFRYRLEGRDSAWQEPVTRRQAFYNDLRPGKYRFRVIACNNDGIWNSAGATLAFSIAPAWYQTNWFQVLCVGAFVISLWALHRLRLQQLRNQFNTKLEARVNERTRIARDLHDTLLQSFHGLMLRFQTVSFLLPARPEEAKEKLDSSIRQAAEAITEGRDAVEGLRSSTVEANDLPMAIRAIGKELAAHETNYSSAFFQVAVEGTPRNLHPILRDEVYRLASEALRNAFRHAQARQIEVEIWYDKKQFRMRIRDNGKGIAPEVLGGEGRSGHYGLHGMRERAKLVGGKLAVWSDLDSGTEVELSIPASTAYATSVRRRSWLSEKFARKDTDA